MGNKYMTVYSLIGTWFLSYEYTSNLKKNFFFFLQKMKKVEGWYRPV